MILFYKIRYFILNLIGIVLILNENFVINLHFHRKNSKIWRVGYLNLSILLLFFVFILLEDISSISGSDSSNDESSDHEGSLNPFADTSYNSCARNNPKIILTLNDNRHISLYRCLLHGKKVFTYLKFQQNIIFIFRIFLKNHKN